MEDFVGILAAGLVLATFCARDFKLLRGLAVASNLAFIGYAGLLSLWPVLALHLVLLPVNLWHMSQLLRPKPSQSVPALPAPRRHNARRAPRRPDVRDLALKRRQI